MKISSIRNTALSFLLALTPLAIVAERAIAEEVAVPVGQQSAEIDRSGLPTNGMSKNEVYTTYGAALKEYPAVGEPPISRWKFESFTVYFEHEKVVHAVAHQTSS